MTKREYIVNEGRKIFYRSFNLGNYQPSDECNIKGMCISTIFNCMNIHKNIFTDGVDEDRLRSILNNLERMAECLFIGYNKKVDTTNLIRIVNHISHGIDVISTTRCVDKIDKVISQIIWMSMVLYSTKYNKDITKILSNCRVYLQHNKSTIIIVVNNDGIIPTIYSYITKYIIDSTNLLFTIQEDDPVIKSYNSPDAWYAYTDEIENPLITQSFELINDIDYPYIIKSIESPKLDTQIAFAILKRRGDNNKERENNMVSKDEILLKVKEITEKIAGRSLPDNIMDKSTISIDTTSESIGRFTIFMEFVDSLTNKLEDDTDKDYIKDIVYNTILSILKYHKNKMDYKTISRLYNTVYTINDMLNKGRSNIGVYPVFDYISWIIYTLYCLSMGNLTELKETAFDIDYDDRTITIDVCNVNNIVYINNLLKNIDRSYMGIRFSIIDDKYYLDRLSKLNMDDFKPKKTIFCIVGESGSGKDTLVSYTLKEFGIPFKTVISYTDREMRENETNGVEHHFVSKDTMVDLLKNMEIASYTKIGYTSYCTLLSDLEESDICIINPNGLNGLKIKYGDRFNFVTVYIDCPYDERKKRLEDRSDFKSSFEKRAFDEEEQFTEFRKSCGYDHVIDNGTISTVYKSAMVLFDIFRYYRKDIR